MVAEEKYEFKPETKRKIFILGAVGVVLFVLGVFLAMSGGHEEHGKAADEHAKAAATENLVASAAPVAAAGEEGASEAEHGNPWVKRVFASLWHNNIFFAGIGIIGLFFLAISYASQAGWSAPVERIPLALGHWIPISGVLMIILWFAGSHELFHWTHHDLYVEGSAEYDEAMMGKSGYFYWPMAAGSFPIFYVGRMVLFFGLWYMFFVWIKREMLAEDLDGSTQHWTKARGFSAIFLVIFAVSSSVAAWDWVMSIDAHWYSTMMGWYVFASWWVTGLAAITLIVVYLKDAGYLKIVTANHLHDLGKYIFAFCIFWTYIWFAQYLLIYYANMPEETVYFVQRRTVAPYNWIFFANLILNFFLPFLLLMTRDSKRQLSTLKLVCPMVIIGHWLDFYLMVEPGITQYNGGLGFLEIGMGLIFMAGFLFVVLAAMSKVPLVAKNHPMLGESMHHHI